MATTIAVGATLMLPGTVVSVTDAGNILVDICGVRVALDKNSLAALAVAATASGAFTAPAAHAWQTPGDFKVSGDPWAVWRRAMIDKKVAGFSA